ncbi:MAG: TldD protein [Myxococcota bacterium]|jgi:TldD protein
MHTLPPERWFEQFGVDDALTLRVLATATQHGADDADLYFEHSVSTSVGLSDHKVNRAHTSVDLGVGVRVVIGDQVGYAYTEDLSEVAMKRAAAIAAEIARDGHASVPPQQVRTGKVHDFYPVKRQWSDVGVSERVPLVREWESQAFSRDARVKNVQVGLSDADKHILIVRADGTRVADYRPMTTAHVSVTSSEGDKTEAGGFNLAGRAGIEFFTQERQDRLVDEAVKRSVDALHAGAAPAGEMPVVLAAGSSGILLHEAIGHGLEADFNRKGISIFADRMNSRIASDEVTIVDDATIQNDRGAINVDDEGSPTEKTTLVQNGVLKSYLHDRISARHYDVEPTGSGRRESFRSTVLPRMSSTYMESGPHDPGEIIASVEKGIYCVTFSNGQVQIGAGDFAFYVRQAYLIENGKLTRPIKDVNLIGNGPKVLETIDMVGNDLKIDDGGWTCGKDGQSVPVSQGMPTVRVASLSVGGQS